MTQLRHVTRMAYGDALAADQRFDGAVPVMSSGGVTGRHNVANTLAPAIVIGRKGSHGSVHWTEDAAFVIDTAYFIDRRFTLANLRWLFYALQAVDLRGVSQDVGVPGLSRDSAYGLRLSNVPTLEEQRRIADFLDYQVALLDRAIRLRQEQMSLVHERSESQLNALYQQRSGEGSIPLVALLVQGPRYGVLVPVHTDDGVPFIRVGDLGRIMQGEPPVASIPLIQSMEYRRTLVEPGDVLTSVVGTLGTSAIVPEIARGANVARAVCLLRPKQHVPSMYLYGWLSTPQYLALAQKATGSGTAQATLNMRDLAKFPVPIPPNGRFEQARGQVQRLFEDRHAAASVLQRGLELLQERKQALITAAVMGQFDVTTARSVA